MLEIKTPFKAEESWIDENGHVNVSRYFEMSIVASDRLCEELGFEEDEYAKDGNTLFTGEFHVTFMREIDLEDEIVCRSFPIELSEKKVVFRHELRHAVDDWVAAIAEELLLSVSFATRRVSPFPKSMYERLAANTMPAEEAAQLPNRSRSVSVTSPAPERG